MLAVSFFLTNQRFFCPASLLAELWYHPFCKRPPLLSSQVRPFPTSPSRLQKPAVDAELFSVIWPPVKTSFLLRMQLPGKNFKWTFQVWLSKATEITPEIRRQHHMRQTFLWLDTHVTAGILTSGLTLLFIRSMRTGPRHWRARGHREITWSFH